ncbi:MAG: DUF2723 domain-containing protein [Planctomycetes bacterium]|nr:DUF2723 domain-containing protein [Planctomycetota bacterium]
MAEITKDNRVSILAGYIGILFSAGALYICTCAPAVLWQDSALFVYRTWHNDIQGNLGLALAHPLYIMIAIAVKHIGLGDLAHRINLISAVFGAVGVANLFLLLRLWTGKTLPAIIGAITLAVSWNFWQHSVIAEVYTLFMAQMLGELIVLLLYVRTKRVGYLYLLGLFNGLAIANHMWAVFGFACYAVFLVILRVRKEIGVGSLVVVILLWLLGALPYEYLIIKNIILSGDVPGTLISAAFGNIWEGHVTNTSMSVKLVLENLAFIILNFPTPNLLFFFAGLWVLLKKAPYRGFANIILALTTLHFVFAFRYTVPDRYAFFLPFYCFAACFIGLGADVILNRFNRKPLVVAVLLFALLPIPVYFVVPTVARKTYKSLAQRRQRPYRDEYDYFLKPWKTGYVGAERFAIEALDVVEKDAIVYASTTDVHALLYVQEVKGKRPDVRIVSQYDKSKNAPALNKETAAGLMGNFPFYVVSPVKNYYPDFLLENYDFVEAGLIYRAVKR